MLFPDIEVIRSMCCRMVSCFGMERSNGHSRNGRKNERQGGTENRVYKRRYRIAFRKGGMGGPGLYWGCEHSSFQQKGRDERMALLHLHIVRKIALNTVKGYKTKTASKRPISRLMFDCLFEPGNILSVLAVSEN